METTVTLRECGRTWMCWLMVASLLVTLAACGNEAPEVEVELQPDASSTDGSMSCSDIPALQQVSEACCPEHGPDACGAELFCAAFGDRSKPTCYPEHSQAGGKECTKDVHCVSMSCNEEEGLCRHVPETECTVEVGCASAPDGSDYACNPDSSSCEPITSYNGSVCRQDGDCDSGHCIERTCTSGEEGATCEEDGDCNEGYCVRGSCTGGEHQDPCVDNADCSDGKCVDDRCSDGDEGAHCERDAHCSTYAPFCVGRECSSGREGDTCHSSEDCRNELECSSGECDPGAEINESCTSTDDCAPQTSELGRPVDVVCDEESGTCRFAAQEKCHGPHFASVCESGYACQDHAPNSECDNGTDEECWGSTCCGPGGCGYDCRDGRACLPE